jgi:hypothetical protein
MDPGVPPPLSRIVRIDFLALFGALFAPIGVAIAAAGLAGLLPDRSRSLLEGRLVTFEERGLPVFWYFALGATLAGAALLLWRAARIRSAFGAGHRVPGVLSRVRPFKDRAYLTYEYEVDGVRVRTAHFVHRGDVVRALREGQPVTVAVDPTRPRLGFIVELFGA